MPPCNRQRPSDWKTSYVTAVPKTPSPDILDETRPVPITPMPSFLCESFVSKWAYADLHPSFDKQQYGNKIHFLLSLPHKPPGLQLYKFRKTPLSSTSAKLLTSLTTPLSGRHPWWDSMSRGVALVLSHGAPPGSPPAGCHVFLSVSYMWGAPGHQVRPVVFPNVDI